MSYFEAELIQYAAPTLFGCKQANLFSIPVADLPKYREEIASYQKVLSRRGICVVYLYSCQKRVFILVYREKSMQRALSVSYVRDYLCSIGYPLENCKGKALLQAAIIHLRKRIQAYHEFPHEIGFFLGYPPADVFAFIREKGQNFKRVGYWKVYGDEEKALRIFQCYEDCREKMFQQVAAGTPLLSLLGVS